MKDKEKIADINDEIIEQNGDKGFTDDCDIRPIYAIYNRWIIKAGTCRHQCPVDQGEQKCNDNAAGYNP